MAMLARKISKIHLKLKKAKERKIKKNWIARKIVS
jgi:hypothetical protein